MYHKLMGKVGRRTVISITTSTLKTAGTFSRIRRAELFETLDTKVFRRPINGGRRRNTQRVRWDILLKRKRLVQRRLLGGQKRGISKMNRGDTIEGEKQYLGKRPPRKKEIF